MAPPTPWPSYFSATMVCKKMIMSSVSSYSETPASAPSTRASYRLTRGLSSTVTLMFAHCARRRITSRWKLHSRCSNGAEIGF